jgi:CTP synthase
VVDIIHNPKAEVEIGFVGKYVGLKDAYKSVDEALTAGGFGNEAKVRLRKVESEDIEKEGPDSVLEGVDGILVPGGFGTRGVEGKIKAVGYAREKKIPFLGICLGMQCAVIDFARNVAGLESANSSEVDPDTAHPVISLLTEQQEVTRLGGTMRLGAEPCALLEGSLAHQAYGESQVSERHRHRYEFNPNYQEIFEKYGMVFSGISPKRRLVEMIELKNHPWFVACQFHPEFKSRPRDPHPIFRDFIGASLEYGKGRREQVEEKEESARS